MNQGGRPPLTGEKLIRCTVYLTSDQVLAAHTAGIGNASDGLRKQLDELAELRQWFADRRARPTAARLGGRRRGHQ